MLHEAAKKKKACSQACMHESSQQAVMERQLCGSVNQQEDSIYARVMCIGSRVGKLPSAVAGQKAMQGQQAEARSRTLFLLTAQLSPALGHNGVRLPRIQIPAARGLRLSDPEDKKKRTLRDG
ncbi:hypothetical protein L1887_43406 [Cichorium endivia]|nr:hypothetical protein L1887_43406 [Cichorium endivia]